MVINQNQASSNARVHPGKPAMGAPGPAADSMSISRRLQQELVALMGSTDQGISAFPIGDSLLSWRGTIKGPLGTIYEGLAFKLLFKFPSNYPFSLPSVVFETPCFHPNVSDLGGEICLDILKENWTALYDVRTILLSIQSLLGGIFLC